eukprot:2168950-Lingulodinium_polyedra.AAC.1
MPARWQSMRYFDRAQAMQTGHVYLAAVCVLDPEDRLQVPPMNVANIHCCTDPRSVFFTPTLRGGSQKTTSLCWSAVCILP